MTNTNVKQIWSAFVTKHNIVAAGVPLFATEGSTVRTKKVGKTYVRNVLERSSAMEALIVTECDKLIDDWQQGTNRYDGLIYMMYRRSLDGEVIPLYIGKTEIVGKRNNNLSVNIKGLKTDKSKFARWGDGHQYHIGFAQQNLAIH